MVAISELQKEELIQSIQNNLAKVIARADEISQEFRTAIHVDLTTKKSGNRLAVVRELLETDSQLRDVIASLRKITSTITVNDDRNSLLRDEEFLAEIYTNLTSMFKGFDRIHELVVFDEQEIENMVTNTITSLDRLSSQ